MLRLVTNEDGVAAEQEKPVHSEMFIHSKVFGATGILWIIWLVIIFFYFYFEYFNKRYINSS